MKKIIKKYIGLSGLFGGLIFMSGCATDRLITRKNHDHDYQFCWTRLAEANGDTSKLNAQLDKEIVQYQELMEEVLVGREQALTITNWITSNIGRDEAIPPHMLDKLNIGMSRGLDLSDKVVSVVAKNECWLQATDEVLAKKSLPEIDHFVRYKGSMLALSATLMLYDTYFTTASILNKHNRIRQFLNQSDSGYGRQEDQLNAVTDTMFNISNVMLVNEEIHNYEAHMPGFEYRFEADTNADYLNTLIIQSPSYPLLRDATIDGFRDRKAEQESAEFIDEFIEFKRVTVNEISKIFGNFVGLIEERKGKLYDDEDSHVVLAKNLKAGDILLEKTPFRLTDKMIPGHWGHAAIWVGTDRELIELGIWDHPTVKPYQIQILNSQHIVEALRSGVEINTLTHFMNIDDVAIIRDPDRTKEETAERIIRTLRQVGKDYDFNFNVETTDKIVCSQLVYLVYTDIKWPTERMLGRYTISPDNVAFKAINSGPLELVVFYHDGKLIKDKPAVLMESLMQQ